MAIDTVHQEFWFKNMQHLQIAGDTALTEHAKSIGEVVGEVFRETDVTSLTNNEISELTYMDGPTHQAALIRAYSLGIIALNEREGGFTPGPAQSRV